MTGPMRTNKWTRRIGESKEFRNARTARRAAAKAARAARKRNR